VRFVGLILRVYSFTFHILLIIFLLAVSSLAWSSGLPLNLEMLPQLGMQLTYWVFGAGVAGLLILILACKKILPVLFVLWTAAVLVLLVRGFFFSRYNFGPGGGSLSLALTLILGALVAVWGSWLQLRHAGRKQARA